MGSTGSALFRDDLACDVRDAYRDLVSAGISGQEATQQLLGDFEQSISDHDEEPVFWLALAATQWDLGRLEVHVRNQALTLIDSGIALDRWLERSEGSSAKRRIAVLAKLRDTLTSPQPTEKRVRPRRPQFEDTLVWPMGGILAYQLQSKKYVLFLVVDSSGCFAFLNWIGDTIPDDKAIRRQEIAKNRHTLREFYSGRPDSPVMFAVMRNREDELDTHRIQWLKVKRPPEKEKDLARNFCGGRLIGGYGIANWGLVRKEETIHIDARLKDTFGWS